MKRVAFCLAWLACCGAEIAADEPAQQSRRFSAADFEYFETRVRPLLVKRCYECHSKKNGKHRGGLLVDNAAAMKKGGDSGSVIVPGNPDESLLVQAIRHTGDAVEMPPTGKLPDEEIRELERWVARGAPFPESGDNQPSVAKGIDLDKGRAFWSFQPLRAQEVPKLNEPGWSRGRLDAFLLANLETHGLRHSSDADRATWLRRVTFDLIGLPPSPDELEEFLADDSPDAYERVVDRLLCSPFYGERWGRFWLDLARYADSTPAWQKSVGQAWRYRDWIIEALNEDVPYDRFVTKQLAADMLEDFQPGDAPALGFLGISPTYWKELRLAPDLVKAVVAEEWDERIDVVSRSFLGLTVSCARCHDHKFDPVSMEDYYALAGVFASTRLVDLPLLPQPKFKVVKEAHVAVADLQDQMETLKAENIPADVKQRKQNELQATIDKIAAETPDYGTPVVHGVEDSSLFVLPDGPDRTRLEYRRGEPRTVPVLLRGNPANEGAVVSRRFLSVLASGEKRSFEAGSGRRELAESIFREGKPLAARVLVNRVWREHFGSGLVTTPSDFGTQGSRPTHPELLEDLARRFVTDGWSFKRLHREIVLSSTYRQASDHQKESFAADPENRWLWRMNRRRLSVESWRDAILAVTGSLRYALHGPSEELSSPANHRRTIYGRVVREDLDDMLRLYDFPDPGFHSPGRDLTTTPLQQLFVLNSEFLHAQSTSLGERMLSHEGPDEQTRIQAAYKLLYCRSAGQAELDLGQSFLEENSGGAEEQRHRWRLYAQILLGSNEFMFVD